MDDYRLGVSSDTRKGSNEAWFRDVNERLEQRAARGPQRNQTFEIVCECASEQCTERIAVSLIGYEEVRRNARAFILLPGHYDASAERVVARHESYEVVEKFGAAGEIAEIENPREGNSD